MRMLATPERASKEAKAEPVAPQPTMAMAATASSRWPSVPMPLNSIWREYLPSSSKGVIVLLRTNLYYRSRFDFRAKHWADRIRGADGVGCRRNEIERATRVAGVFIEPGNRKRSR